MSTTVKEELVKLQVSIDFRCNPTFNIINYTDEVIDNAKIYKDITNKKDLVGIGEIWCSMNVFSTEPFWKTEMVILKKNLTKEIFIEKSKELYQVVFSMINEGKENFINNINNLRIPDNNYFDNRYNNKLNECYWKEMPLSKFKSIIMEKVFEEWNKNFENSTIEKNKYETFIKIHLYEQKLDELITKFRVLKIENNNVYFNSKKDYDQFIKTVVSFVVESFTAEFFDVLEQHN